MNKLCLQFFWTKRHAKRQKSVERMYLKICLVLCGLMALSTNEGNVSKVTNATSKIPIPSTVFCDKGWYAGFFECYKVVPIKSTWIGSFAYCLAMKGSLVDINSQADQDELTTVLRYKYPNLSGTKLWIGGQDMSSKGHWKWSTFGQDFSYNHWAKNKTEPSTKDHNCVLLDGDTFKMETGNCDSLHHFVCQAVPF